MFCLSVYTCLSFYFQTISNGTVPNKEKEVRDREEKENTNNIQNSNLTPTIDTNSNSIKETRNKKKDNSKLNKTVIKSADIPNFYFPHGRPPEKDSTDEVLLRVSQEFSKFEDGKVTQQQMGIIAKVIFPRYFDSFGDACHYFVAQAAFFCPYPRDKLVAEYRVTGLKYGMHKPPPWPSSDYSISFRRCI